MGVKPGLTRREEHRLRVFDIWVMRMISGVKRKGSRGMKKAAL